MHGVKNLGKGVVAQDLDRQVAGFRVRVVVLTGFTARGTPNTKVAGSVCPGTGDVRPTPVSGDRAVVNRL